MNAPEPHDLLVLPPDARKVTVEKDTHVPDAATFTIEKEDHTLGNLLRMHLLKYPEVLFAGYKMPHPLEHRILVKVQTQSHVQPEAITDKCIDDLLVTVRRLEDGFQEQLREARGPGYDMGDDH